MSNKNPIPEYLDALQPDTPEPEPPSTPTSRAVEIGAKLGAVAGLVISQIYIGAHSVTTPFGSIYSGNSGNIFIVFAVWIGIGSALGAGIGWVVANPDSGQRKR